jgi:hypothetical protein
MHSSSDSSLDRAVTSGSHGEDNPLLAEPPERRRRAVRYPCSSAIRFAWTSNFDRYAIGDCVDISRNGLRMLSSEPIPVRTKVCFKSDSWAFGGSGTVRFCRMHKGKYVIGLDFAGGLTWQPM